MLKLKLLKNHRTRTRTLHSMMSTQQSANQVPNPMKGKETPIHVNRKGGTQSTNPDQSDQWDDFEPVSQVASSARWWTDADQPAYSHAGGREWMQPGASHALPL